MDTIESVRIRMYKHGLGDCFLVTLFYGGARKFHILIDCGVILGTPNPEVVMQKVATNIRTETDGVLDVVVVTHEHWDHLSGFLQAREIFDNIQFNEVWMAWTEDRDNALAKKLRKTREDRKKSLQVALTELRKDADSNQFLNVKQKAARQAYLSSIEELASFNGGLAAGPGNSTTDALDYVKNKAKALYYCTPGTEPFRLKGITGLQFYVLGPPEDEKLIKKDLASKEVYHMVYPADIGSSFISAMSANVGQNNTNDKSSAVDKYLPFDKYTGTKLDNADSPVLQDYNSATEEWRKIDSDWMDYSGQLALALDNDTNNTSLVLALELEKAGKFLLFPGDAQVGNWLSWHNYSWNRKREGAKKELIDIKHIFEHTVFYKVGHHGSHNATLSHNGLELMTSNNLTVMIPVDQEMAKKKRWNMPFPSLLANLKEKSHGRVLIADESFDSRAEKPNYIPQSEWQAFCEAVNEDEQNLYVDYRIDVSRMS